MNQFEADKKAFEFDRLNRIFLALWNQYHWNKSGVSYFLLNESVSRKVQFWTHFKLTLEVYSFQVWIKILFKC